MEGHKKIPYPKQIIFIIVNEFCERFSYYGMKAILAIYLSVVLEYGDDTSTTIYHVFSGLCYFTPLLGAMLADSFLGKFKTILYLSIVYAMGNIILSLAAAPVGLPQSTFSIIGLFAIALGTGGIKPCVSAFGGDQFVLPHQALQLSTFFSIFYFSINAGSLISTFITPIFRKGVSCFGSKTCYPLAFGVPAIIMVVAVVIFVIGKPWYKIRKADGNIVMKVTRCITHAVNRKKSVVATGDVKNHWLDYADDKYDKRLIEDVKILLRILVLYIPLPFFWALFDQQGSRWTLQATRMNGKTFGWTIIPDQMQVVNPFLILALIPIFDQIVYPAFKKVHFLTKPLQRLTFGGILAGVAFIISGVLELNLEPTYAVKLSPNESQIHFINTLPCNITLNLDGELGSRSIESFDISILSRIPVGNYKGSLTVNSANPNCSKFGNIVSFTFVAENQKAYSYLIGAVDGSIVVKREDSEDELEKSKEGNPKIKFLLSGLSDETERNSTLLFFNAYGTVVDPTINLQTNISKVTEIDPGEYTMKLFIPANETQNYVSTNKSISGNVDLRLGGNYMITLIKNSAGEISGSSFIITQPNSIHILWLLPQYIVITIAEVMFSITGLEFSFSHAPKSMKSVIQACWLLTVAFGNLIVVFITEFVKLGSQSKEFFLFAGLMFIDMIIFAIMAYFYKPSKIADDEDEENKDMEFSTVHENKSFEKES